MSKITQSKFLVKGKEKSLHGYSKSFFIGTFMVEQKQFHRKFCQAWSFHSLLISLPFRNFVKKVFSLAAANIEAGTDWYTYEKTSILVGSSVQINQIIFNFLCKLNLQQFIGTKT